MSNHSSSIIFRPLSSDRSFRTEFDGQCCSVFEGKMLLVQLYAENTPQNLTLQIENLLPNSDRHEMAIRIGMERLLSLFSKARHIRVLNSGIKNKDSILSHFEIEPGYFALERKDFFQMPGLWHLKSEESITSETWTKTQGREHPQRPSVMPGYHYRRYISHLNKTISFRVIDPNRDLQIFYEWHHQPRVLDFWELNKPMNELQEYIQKGLEDAHQIPMIVEFDQEPVGYFEMYWTSEDRLAPYYDYLAYDRGLHFLIGNTKFLGFENTDAVLKSACHFLFLDDPRTSRIMAEPRHDNLKVLRYAEAQAWRNIKTFDFPHKRAVLLEQNREDFFFRDSL